MEDNLKSPDMVKFADVLQVIAIYGKSFKSEKDLAEFIRERLINMVILIGEIYQCLIWVRQK